MTAQEAAQIMEVRQDPLLFFNGWGRFRDEQTREPARGKANVLQRRVFEHYRRCQEAGKPCRMAFLKYRRAGSSTASECLMYMHAQNYEARCAVIGTDYKASTNMLEMCAFFGLHDDFPGWGAKAAMGGERKVKWQEYFDGQDLSSVPFEDRTDKVIATKIDFTHGSTVELYTARNRESARSAGLNAYHATECGRWPTGGVHDAGETLTAMRNALPKRGFHLAIEESTANGAQGAFYDTCRSARWPEYADWPAQWRMAFPLAESEYGRDLQFVFIFAAWFEDSRHLPDEPLTSEQEERLRDSLDEDEKQLIARYQREGPRGPRLGDEVEATAWEQIAWRRAIIKNVCTRGGAEEFKQEYPASPDEAFRASGAPALDMEGLLALEMMARTTEAQYGILTPNKDGKAATWQTTPRQQALFMRWEEPQEGLRYILSCDPMSGAEQVTSTGEKDRHSVFVLRDAYTDHRGRFHLVKAVARIMPPCQWESEVLTRQIYLLALYYGGATIAVEANAGIAILKSLANDYPEANIYQREELDKVTQRTTLKLGWWTSELSRRLIVATLQKFVREQLVEVLCPHAVGEMMTLVINARGKVEASGSNHDDDGIALGIGLELLPAAHEYPRPPRVQIPDWTAWR